MLRVFPRQIRPDGCDWQIIGCSNCLQCFSRIPGLPKWCITEQLATRVPPVPIPQ